MSVVVRTQNYFVINILEFPVWQFIFSLPPQQLIVHYHHLITEMFPSTQILWQDQPSLQGVPQYWTHFAFCYFDSFNNSGAYHIGNFFKLTQLFYFGRVEADQIAKCKVGQILCGTTCISSNTLAFCELYPEGEMTTPKDSSYMWTRSTRPIDAQLWSIIYFF